MNTTVLVDSATRDALASARDVLQEPSLDALIRRVLRDATPTASELWRKHRAAAQGLVRAYGVKRLIAFGSRVRDDRHPGSDLDLVVDMPKDGGVVALFALRDELSRVLQVQVDLGDLPAHGSRLWKRIEQEGVALVGPAP
ncbi:MAG: nucleotidyltransferase domain-containing protein [Candidatus Thermoplasmatota archaeon]